MQSPAVSGDEKSFVVGALNVYESQRLRRPAAAAR